MTPAAVPDRLAASAFDRPDAPFLVAGDEVVTYGEADDRVARLAGGLVAAAGRPGGRVAVWGGVDVDTALVLLAIARAGLVAVPINPRVTADVARAQGEAADVCLWVGIGGGCPEPDTVTVASLLGPHLAGVERLAREEAVVVFTSGTTGAAKGVRLSRGAIDASAVASASVLDHRSTDRWLAVLPLCHVGGISVLHRSALVGGSVHLEPAFLIEGVAGAVDSCTLASLVSPMLHRLLAADVGPGSLRSVLLGGGPIPPGLAEEAVAAGWPVLPTYGQTEAASQVATCPSGTPGRRAAAPLPGTEVRVVGDSGDPVVVGGAGAIEVRGPTLFTGYLGQPDLEPGAWHRTGDLGMLDADGLLSVVGRADDVIVTGGENVHPGPVEDALVGAGALEAAVVGLPDDEWGRVVAAVVVGADPATLAAAIRGRVPGYAVPRRWATLDALPRTDLGKVDRDATLAVAEFDTLA